MSKRAPIGRPPGGRGYEFNPEAAISARLRKGYSRLQLSRRCDEVGPVGVRDSNIAKYERGDACPSPPTLRALATALDVEVDELVTIRAAAETGKRRAAGVSAKAA